MNKLLTSTLVIVNVILIFLFTNSITSEIYSKNKTQALEDGVKLKLVFLRNLQIAHKNQKGHYANSWADLEKFVQKDNIYVIEKIELIDFDSVSNSETYQTKYDTLKKVSVFDSLIAKTEYHTNELNKIPGFGEKTSFSLATDIVRIQEIDIEVLEISCPIGINPKMKSEKLKIGSLESPTLSGNWR